MEHVTFPNAIIALAVLGALMVGVALFRIVRDWGKPYVILRALGPGRHRIATSRGRAEARLIFHDDLGKVYAIESNFRGEGAKVTYVPPAIEMVRTNIVNRVLNLHETSRSPR